tara:strand:- start:2185 stop:4251 length:2067 start_codon:yes stop_codon:yes gene_type:complete
MAGANSNIQIADLDFNKIKTNLKTFLQSQAILQDYNYEGSALSTLLDILAYNTQYNAYYLNMVANEMFLDSALQRASVVSHAKLLNYTPKSAIAPTAIINLAVNSVSQSSLTLPKFTTFLSEAIDGVNYNFVTTDSYTVNTSNGSVLFANVPLKQGIPTTVSYTVDNITNPTYTFEIPDADVDTTALQVIVQQSSANAASDVYTLATNYLSLTNDSKVFFLQESTNGNFEIYFGDNILGKQLTNGNIVNISYIITSGTASYGANNFVLMDTIAGYSSTSISPVSSATEGSEKETISSIKFQAPKSYGAQNRAVTKDDYITLIQKNQFVPLDAVNVWGGEDNESPEYGTVYVAVKPKGSYSLTEAQKASLINDVIKPVSVITVTPRIVDIDYVYLLLSADILYDSKKTTKTSSEISNLVKNGIQTFCETNLNTFNSTFVIGNLIQYVQVLDPSIIAADFDLFLQKRLIPSLRRTQTYTVNFGNALERGTGKNALTITPSFSQYDSTGSFYENVFFEEAPDSTTNIDYVTISSGGTGYVSPTVTISGDGVGATATAEVVNGIITAITVVSGGAGYTQAIAVITDSEGSGAIATPVLRGNYGNLRTYYFVNGVKNILTGGGTNHTDDAGSVDYTNGIVTLSNFTPTALAGTDGILRVTGYSASRIVSSNYSRIITLDTNDTAAITVNVTAK